MLQETEIFCSGPNNFLSTPSCVGFFYARFNSNNSEFQWLLGVFIAIEKDGIGSEFFNAIN